MTKEIVSGRQPFFYVEIDLDYCALAYGVGACTASGSASDSCYNTFVTCQDRVNFSLSSKTYRFCDSKSMPPVGFDAFPVIDNNPQITPARLIIEQGIGQRGACTIELNDFPHDDRGIDPYYKARPGGSFGTFFNKLRRRNPFYANRPFRLITGYISGANILDIVTRLYLINSFDGADKKGYFKINAKDVLKLVDDKSSVYPPVYDVMTTTAINSTQTTIQLRTGDAAKLPATGYIRLDEEIIYFGSKTTDQLNCIRQQWRTIADNHDANKPVIFVKGWTSRNIVDVIYELLVTHAGVDPAYIPYNNNPLIPDEWDNEKANWLSGNTIYCIINEPTRINELLAQICQQNSLSLWWNEKEQKVKLSASSVALGNQTPQYIDSESNIVADSFSIVEDYDTRLSQIWIYYDPNNYGLDMDDPENYRDLKIYINDTFEQSEAYGAPRIKKIFAWWLSSVNAAIVSTIASRLITKDLTQNFKISFTLDAKDAALWTGEFALLDHPELQGVDGLTETQKVQITQVKEKEPGHLFEYKAVAKVFDQAERFFFIATNTVGDYTTATDTEKLENGFISDGGAQFADGGAPYSITG